MNYSIVISFGVLLLVLSSSISFSQHFDYVEVTCYDDTDKYVYRMLRESRGQTNREIETLRVAVFRAKGNLDTLSKKSYLVSLKVKEEIFSLLDSINLNERLVKSIEQPTKEILHYRGCVFNVGSANFSLGYCPDLLFQKDEFEASPEKRIISLIKKNSRTCFFKRNRKS
jgi:hypothetical protein